MDDHIISAGDRTVAARVFLSYATEDRKSAEQLAATLTDHGWDIWWDRRLFAGSSFDEVIEQQLDAALAAVVLWSTTSVQSEWVRAEATAAIERDVLIPVLIEPCRVPLRFRNVHTLDLSGWDGDPADERFDELERALQNLTQGQVVDERRSGPADQHRVVADDQPDERTNEQPLDRRLAEPERVGTVAPVSHPTWYRRRHAVPIAIAVTVVVAVALGLIAILSARDSASPAQQSSGDQETVATTRDGETTTTRDDEIDEEADDRPDIRSDGLDVGDWMYVGDRRTSANGRYLLLLQVDGNLVVEDTDDPPAGPVWASGTAGHPNAGAFMQADGNFIIFGDRESEDLLGTVVFTTGTEGNDGAVLTIRNDGVLVVESRSGTVLFNSNR